MTSFVVDTNVISDLLKLHIAVKRRRDEALKNGDHIFLPHPVIYETMRGLLHKNATRKIQMMEQEIIPLFTVENPTPEDWSLCANIWAQTRRAGKQFSDADLLIAAITQRVGGTLVTADDDFASLNIQRVNWRQ